MQSFYVSKIHLEYADGRWLFAQQESAWQNPYPFSISASDPSAPSRIVCVCIVLSLDYLYPYAYDVKCME